MYKNHSIKTSIVVGILLMTTLGLLVPSTSASPTIDVVDGIWSDDFKYVNETEGDENLSYENCTVDYVNGIVTLIESPEGLMHDFKGSGHNAYKYRSKYFIPLTKKIRHPRIT